MFNIVWLIQHYGYAIVFFLSLLEGETIVALAGIAAYQGYLRLDWVIAVAIVGAMFGDQLFFYLGRTKGKKFLTKRPKLAARLARIHKLLERYPGAMTFGSRFMYGFRTVIPMALGTTKISGFRFFIFNFIGAVVWGIFFALGGYMFGTVIEHFIVNLKRAQKYIILGIVLGIAITQLTLFIRRRLAQKIEEKEVVIAHDEGGEKADGK